MNGSPLKIDFHVHTLYSHDSKTSLKEVLVYAKRRGLDGVAITDHDAVEGAIKLSELCNKNDDSFIVIQGLEVSSKHGHILALNVNELIRDMMRDLVLGKISVEEVAQRVKSLYKPGMSMGTLARKIAGRVKMADVITLWHYSRLHLMRKMVELLENEELFSELFDY